jgi:Kef-type K+ transport system membrane component KefB
VNLGGLLVVAVVAFVAPLVVNTVPRLHLPSPVAEILAGVAIGPSGLGWVHIDTPITVVAMLGLSMLLFLAGLEIDVELLRGRVLRYAALGMAVSLLLALGVGYLLDALGVVHAPVLIAITLAATALGLIIPLLKDAGELRSPAGVSTVAGATVAEFTCITLLSLLFSRETSGTAARIVLLLAFAVAVLLVGATLVRFGETMRISAVLTRLQDTTAQIRVRFAVVLFIGFAALAARFGLETILGAFVAGAMLKVVDRDAAMVHPLTVVKLEAIGFGFLVPVFWVTTGLRFDIHALFASGSTLARVPIFVAALLFVRAVPALIYRGVLARRQILAVGLFQATSLSFIVAATQIGLELGLVSSATAAALVGAGLLSAVLFPPIALSLLERSHAPTEPASKMSAALAHP